jgi:hypothetical protein
VYPCGWRNQRNAGGEERTSCSGQNDESYFVVRPQGGGWSNRGGIPANIKDDAGKSGDDTDVATPACRKKARATAGRDFHRFRRLSFGSLCCIISLFEKRIFVTLIVMTSALKNIFSKLSKMPAAEQNAIAALLKEELAWEKSFASSQDELSNLAAEALGEYKKGKTQSLKLK